MRTNHLSYRGNLDILRCHPPDATVGQVYLGAPSSSASAQSTDSQRKWRK